MSEQHPTPSVWPRRGSHPPQWVSGIFYPIVVAALVGVLVVVQGLREDVAVIKVKVEHHEKQLERVLLRVSARPGRRFDLSGGTEAGRDSP